MAKTVDIISNHSNAISNPVIITRECRTNTKDVWAPRDPTTKTSTIRARILPISEIRSTHITKLMPLRDSNVPHKSLLIESARTTAIPRGSHQQATILVDNIAAAPALSLPTSLPAVEVPRMTVITITMAMVVTILATAEIMEATEATMEGTLLLMLTRRIEDSSHSLNQTRTLEDKARMAISMVHRRPMVDRAIPNMVDRATAIHNMEVEDGATMPPLTVSQTILTTIPLLTDKIVRTAPHMETTLMVVSRRQITICTTIDNNIHTITSNLHLMALLHINHNNSSHLTTIRTTPHCKTIIT